MAAPHPPSEQARLTLKDAFHRLRDSVSPDDRRTFQNTELQDVRGFDDRAPATRQAYPEEYGAS